MSKFRSSFALARSPPPKYLFFQVTVFCCCLFVCLFFCLFVCLGFGCCCFLWGGGCVFGLFFVLSLFPRRFVVEAAAAVAVFVTSHLLITVS